MRIVLDTNTIVSGVIGTGPPRQLVDAAKRGDFELAISPVLLAELLDVLGRTKFAARLAQAGLTPAGIVGDLRALAIVVTPATVPRVVARDPDDDQVLACAVSSNADLIVSGDKRDLLPLQNYLGIPIITAREAVERIAA
ncbi:MAG: putative toxin-antitoxin system toxin component, PIN family [Betaproteobacteria bacterium]